MFKKHPLRDFMFFLLIGITLTFTFNAKADNTGPNTYTSANYSVEWSQ